MGGMFGSRSNASTAPKYTQVQVQTSAEGMALSIVYGVNRLAPNLIFVADFQQHKSGGGKKGGGKGGGGKGGGGTTTYSASVILALCEGPILEIGEVYINSSPTPQNTSALGLNILQGGALQTPFAIDAFSGYVPMAYRNVCYLCANNYSLGQSATIPQHAVEVYGFFADGDPGATKDINPALIIYDLCTNARYGLGMSPSQLGSMTQYQTYCSAIGLFMSPVLSQQEQALSILQRWAQLTNTWIFWSENQLKFVPLGDTSATGNGVTYTPVTTIQYALTDDDFVSDRGAAPLMVTRSDPVDSYNWVKVNISDRLLQYSPAVMEYKDQTSIVQFGLLQANDIQASEICDRGIGGMIASLIGQRALYIRNTYAFNLSYNFILLEPGDIVSLTESSLGLVDYPVRICTIDENDKGGLSFTAEECPSGVGTAIAIGLQPSAAVSLPGIDADPGPVNTPEIIEPPASVTGNVAQIWIGASGANPLWGGAIVHISTDDVTYISAGTIDSASPQGTLINSLPSHADPDTADTLAVDFTESLQILSSAVTHADADALRSLITVDSEIIGFGSVVPNTLNSFSYNLTYLRRGVYSSSPVMHAIGAPATVIIPSNMLQVALPQSYVGVTIYVKLCSFNIRGGGLEDISTVTRYTYVPTGVVYTIAPPTSPVLTISTPSEALSIAMTLAWTATVSPGVGSYEVQFSEDSGATWTAADINVGAAATSYTFTPALAFTNYRARVRAFSSNGLAISSWATSAIVNSGAAPSISGGAAELPLVNGDLPIGIVTDSTGVPVYVVQ